MALTSSGFRIGIEHHCSTSLESQGLQAAGGYVPRRGKRALGDSDDNRGKFINAGVHVLVVGDFEVVYEDPKHGKYFARLLIVVMNAPAIAKPVLLCCGQEIDRRDAPPDPLSATYLPESHGPCHVVELDGMPGEPFYVVTMPRS